MLAGSWGGAAELQGVGPTRGSFGPLCESITDAQRLAGVTAVASGHPSAFRVVASLIGLVAFAGGLLGIRYSEIAVFGGVILHLLANGRYIPGQAASAAGKLRRALPPRVTDSFVPGEDTARAGGLMPAAGLVLLALLWLLITLGTSILSSH